MSFRSDEDALLARNDALEDENRRLRDELTRREQKAPPAVAPREEVAPAIVRPATPVAPTAATGNRVPVPHLEPGMTLERAQEELAELRGAERRVNRVVMSVTMFIGGGLCLLPLAAGLPRTPLLHFAVGMLLLGLLFAVGIIPAGGAGTSSRAVFLQELIAAQRRGELPSGRR